MRKCFLILVLLVSLISKGQVYNIGANQIAYTTGGVVWCGTATTLAGVATFNIDASGTGIGSVIFHNIKSISLIASRNTAIAIDVPFCSIKQITTNKKIVYVNVITGRTISNPVLSVPSAAFVPDGTTVYLTITGN